MAHKDLNEFICSLHVTLWIEKDENLPPLTFYSPFQLSIISRWKTLCHVQARTKISCGNIRDRWGKVNTWKRTGNKRYVEGQTSRGKIRICWGKIKNWKRKGNEKTRYLEIMKAIVQTLQELRMLSPRVRHFGTSCSKWLEPPGFLISWIFRTILPFELGLYLV